MTRKPARRKAGKQPDRNISVRASYLAVLVLFGEFDAQEFICQLRKRGYRIVRAGRKK